MFVRLFVLVVISISCLVCFLFWYVFSLYLSVDAPSLMYCLYVSVTISAHVILDRYGCGSVCRFAIPLVLVLVVWFSDCRFPLCDSGLIILLLLFPPLRDWAWRSSFYFTLVISFRFILLDGVCK